MKVCFFNQEFLPTKGGIATFVGNLVVNVAKDSRIEKVVSISFNNPEAKHEEKGKLEIINYKENSLIKIFFLVLKNFWKYKNYDIFQITYIFPMGIFVLPLAKLFRKKVFVNIHGTDVLTKDGSKKTKFFKKIIMKYCDKILSVSKSTASFASNQHRISLNKFSIIYPGMNEMIIGSNIVDIRPKYFLGNDDFVILTVCRMVKRKGVDDVIRALSLIKDKRVKFVVVGGGPELENLKNLANDLGLQDRIIFTGKVENIASYYYYANLFIMPSRFIEENGDIEGLGIVFIEAQYFGKPVIGTNSGGIPEVILDNKTGFIVPENNPAAIAEKIKLLKDDRVIYEIFSENAKSFVKEKFNWSKSVKDLIKIYEGD